MASAVAEVRIGIASAEALRRHLEATTVVEIEDLDGSRWGFAIRPVEAGLLDPEREWYAKLVGTDPDGFKKRLAEAVRAPSDIAFKAVLVRGVAQPEITPAKSAKAVWVDDLIRRDFLARRLYAEIMRVTLEGIFDVVMAAQPSGEPGAEPRPTP